MTASISNALSDFFFVKQKTAYEMRISDWSSDVCSSDLFDDAAIGARRFLAVRHDDSDADRIADESRLGKAEINLQQPQYRGFKKLIHHGPRRQPGHDRTHQ